MNEGETYEYTTMYPEFTVQAKKDRDDKATADFEAQIQESAEHADTFRRAAHRFGLLEAIEHHHADRYTEALTVLNGGAATAKRLSRLSGDKPCLFE